MTEYKQKFYQAWYSIHDDKKQVIVFPELGDRRGKIERIEGKIRQFSSLDETIKRVERGMQTQIMFSPKKILQNSSLKDLTVKAQVKEYLETWMKNFEGMDLTICFHIDYERKTTYPKITGWISRKSVIIY